MQTNAAPLPCCIHRRRPHPQTRSAAPRHTTTAHHHAKAPSEVFTWHGIGKNPDAYGKGDPRRVYAYYAKEIGKPNSRWKTDWEGWRDGAYIPQSGHDPRGKAYEAKVIKDFGLTGPDWICQKEIKVRDPKTGTVHRRILDAINKKTREIVEIKSNDKPEDSQKPKDLELSRNEKWKKSGYKIRYIFAEERGGKGQKFFDEMRRNLGKDALGRERVTIHEHRSNAIEKAPAKSNNSPYRYNAPYMNADPSKTSGSRGGAVDQIKQSKATPKDMADFINRRNQASGGRFPKGPGGIDFTSLDLKYVGKPVKGEGLDYAFSAKKAPGETGGWGGKAKAQMLSDAFFTWLALTPDKFWSTSTRTLPARSWTTRSPPPTPDVSCWKQTSSSSTTSTRPWTPRPTSARPRGTACPRSTAGRACTPAGTGSSPSLRRSASRTAASTSSTHR
ncbi:hypothetical protein ACFTZI_34085 [Streptomyces decoyicus]|uniref:hypothetical protein n=1 Tax=Streptomyces decoyicus TaxID=249567 RepID=UPI00364510B4